MVSQLTIRVEGLPEALAHLDRMTGTALRHRVVRALDEGGKALAPGMQAEAPVRTGALRRSVAVYHHADGTVTVGPRIFYSRYVIRGTSRGVRPNPFVDRAVDKNLNRAIIRIRDVMVRDLR